ncbi:MAG TPA: von Willebrand factor type A domain-containing protein, partial [Candidatus Limnocylindria bacterium]|nr:von Willebrand factor type A domain-containing protein [Candidatus Limnocylindria bacterium]
MSHICAGGHYRLIALLSAALFALAACTQKIDSPPTETQVPPASTTSAPPADSREKSVATGQAKPVDAALSMPIAPMSRDVRQRAEDGRLGASSPASHPHMPPHFPRRPPVIVPGVDRFPEKQPNGVVSVAEQPVSTFSADVDTASYAFVRRVLGAGRLPAPEAVRVEEMVNYFPYAYPVPESRQQPFRVTATVMPSAWNAENQLLHIAIRGYDIAHAERPRANVVLLIDTSGSMQPNDRLPLLQQGFRLLAQQLRDDDRVAIVAYAGQAQIALEPTTGKKKHKIIEAIDNLRAAGSTAGGDGLRRAYALAERHFDKQAVNRVILATDGDFNVGITDPKELERFIAAKRKTGIYLSILGVGMGNLNDALMQRLAQTGNGNAAYIDSLLEARKAMSEELSSTMFPIADNVKIQVEFNPALVAEYRLIGYE